MIHRERSCIEFPYGVLKDAIDIAQVIHNQYGTECEPDQLAAALKQSGKSGSFRLKVSAARMFGIIEGERGKVRLTELGRQIVDPAKRRRAGADAFLNVALYSAIYEHWRGHTLPSAGALENKIAELGVSKKQVSKARQAFERSADQAGYFESGKDRLVRPGNLGEPVTEIQNTNDKPSGSGSGSGGGDEYDPFILGLLKRLPPADSSWSMEKRAAWLQAAENVFKLMYKGGEDGSITIQFNATKQQSDERSESGGASEAH